MNIIGLNTYPTGLNIQTLKLLNVFDTLNIDYKQSDFKHLEHNTNIISMNPYHISRFENYITGMNNIGLWTWETCNFPEKYAKVAKHFRQIWVLSRWNKDIIEEGIERCNIQCDVNVIKLPFICEDTTNKNYMDDILKMLFIYDKRSGKRKNISLLIDAVNNVNNPYAICNLTLKAINETRYINTDTIKLINSIYTEKQIEDLYNSCNLYTSLHSSEGFGFTIIDAMRLGISTICTGFSGNMEYCSYENSFLVDYDMFYSNETYFEGDMAKPNISHFKQIVNNIHNNKDTAIEKAKVAFNDIKRGYNIDSCSSVLERYLP